MTRSWKASRGREFEFDRFRHDDGRLRPVLRMERRIEEMHWGLGEASLDRGVMRGKRRINMAPR